jgi:hypothetical protein
LAWFEPFGGREIERRPRGASRAALAPTFVSGQLILRDLRADALAHGAISRCMNQAVARARNRRYWPETNNPAGFARGRLGAWRDIALYEPGGRARPQQALLARNK